jgi:hypothetical protein
MQGESSQSPGGTQNFDKKSGGEGGRLVRCFVHAGLYRSYDRASSGTGPYLPFAALSSAAVSAVTAVGKALRSVVVSESRFVVELG